MTSIDTIAYTYVNRYAYSNSKYGAGGLQNTLSKSLTSEDAQTRTGDRVSLSSGVMTARTREYLGLPPTGKLKLSDFETAAAGQKQTVNNLLASTMAEQGIDPDQKATLSLNEDGDIVIQEDFTGKDQLEAALNDNSDFSQAFCGAERQQRGRGLYRSSQDPNPQPCGLHQWRHQ